MPDQITTVLDEITARAEKASPGPWLSEQGSDENDVSKWSVRETDGARFAGGFWIAEMNGSLAEGTEPDNAAFIASARADIPRLVAALKHAIDTYEAITAVPGINAEQFRETRRVELLAILEGRE